MIEILNRLVDEIEENLAGGIDVAAIATASGTTDYHLRRMFSSWRDACLSICADGG